MTQDNNSQVVGLAAHAQNVFQRGFAVATIYGPS